MVASRTHLSTLERGQKSPTLDKLHGLTETKGIRLLSLMTLTCLYFEEEDDIDKRLSRIRSEVASVRHAARRGRLIFRKYLTGKKR